MLLRLITRHDERFDILTRDIDLTKSPYCKICDRYEEKARAFYDRLGIASAIWAWRENEPPKNFEYIKPIEYLLEMDSQRIVAYVDAWSWEEYLVSGRLEKLRYATTPTSYQSTSILIAAPINKDEVLEFRRYRGSGRPDQNELVERGPFRQ